MVKMVNTILFTKGEEEYINLLMKFCQNLCILESGELFRKGERGCLARSTSLKSSFFSTGLLILGLDFRLFDCKEVIQNIKAETRNSTRSDSKHHTSFLFFLSKKKLCKLFFSLSHLRRSSASVFPTRTMMASFFLIFPKQPLILLIQYIVFFKQQFDLHFIVNNLDEYLENIQSNACK